MRTWPVEARSPVFPIAEGRALLFLAVLLALISTVSCSANDRTERSTTRVHSSQRVLSLLPAATEVLVALRDRIAEQLTDIQRSAGPDSLRVLYLIWPTPPRVAAASTFVNELLNIAGARNAVSDLRGWPEVSLEEIIRRDPDLIILSIDDAQKISPNVLSQQTGWKETRAVRNDRVVAVSGDLFNRPGTRVVAAAQLLADAVRSARRSGQ